MDDRIEILKNNLLTLCDNVIDIGVKFESQLSFLLQNVEESSIDQINVFVTEFYEDSPWKWAKYEFYDNNFKGTCDYPENVGKKL